MMGDKTPNEMRAEILAAFKRAALDPTSWLNEQIAKLKRGRPPRASEAETLKRLRDGLLEQSAKKSRKQKTARKNGAAARGRKPNKSRASK
jgi:hypothetical protein